jgi:uncharacterized integral membrane protein
MKFLSRLAVLLIIGACVVAVAWFVELNSEQVTVSISSARSMDLPLGAWLILAFVAGACFHWLSSLPRRVYERWTRKRLQRQLTHSDSSEPR